MGKIALNLGHEEKEKIEGFPLVLVLVLTLKRWPSSSKNGGNCTFRQSEKRLFHSGGRLSGLSSTAQTFTPE